MREQMTSVVTGGKCDNTSQNSTFKCKAKSKKKEKRNGLEL